MGSSSGINFAEYCYTPEIYLFYIVPVCYIGILVKFIPVFIFKFTIVDSV